MKRLNPLELMVDLPKLFVRQTIQPLRLSFRKPLTQPETQADLAKLVDHALAHEIRAGFTHRFITLLFVTVDERVFCRRYQYTEPSWHGVFLNDPAGQVKLDKTVVTINAHVPNDLASILPAIDAAYAGKLEQLGARFLLDGAIEPRAQQSTLELKLARKISG
ncbi:DUF2255 family protein [Labrenzia sp. PHM005]|uniref:DUF2255 family protein n=1 Tax=Labrenzia sp. PHM005 TaxID=2590016 RepID=UPI00143DB83E|nr:DUF2255 family protein [Labrenzia sp. PHM005]